MIQLITSPERFANFFNCKVSSARRQVTVDDVRLLTECGLIKHYGFYDNTDLQTVIAILKYKQLREKTT